MKKIITILILCTLCISISRGQTSGTPSLPQLTTPSPKATMIERFGNYPTNLYTGLVDITVPIHTIEVKGLKIPIEFKYHGSGLKYDDLPMELGYGWTLIAGGVVNYSARGLGISHPDGTRLTPYVKNISDIVINDKTGRGDSEQLQLDYVENGTKNSYQSADYFRDSEYDVYNFTFPGHSGQLYEMDGGHSFTIPSNMIFGGGYFPTAIDEHGNRYYFESGDSDDYVRTRTNYLTRILSADGKETINFKYTYFGETEVDDVKRPLLNYTFIVKDIIRNDFNTVTSEIDYGGGMPGIAFKRFRTPILTEINSSSGKVKFHYAPRSHSLIKIEITSPRDVILKTITLAKTNNNAYLNAVHFCTPTGSLVHSYKFEYNGVKPEGNVRIDYWGYYNDIYDSPSNTLYVPDFTVPRWGYDNGQKIPGMNRNPDAYVMQLGVLRKITYPTQGYTEFTYEPHRSLGRMYGGLRVAEIKNYDKDRNLLESKWYKYGLNEDGNGRAIRRPQAEEYCIPFLTIENLRNHYGESLNTPARSITSRTYYPFPICSYFAQGSTVVYPYIAEYVGTPSGAYGKTEYEYSDFPDPTYDWTWRGYAREIPLWSYPWKCGKLIRQTVKNSHNEIVYSLENEYEENNREDHLNLKVSRFARIVDNGAVMSEAERRFSITPYGDFGITLNGSLYDYYNYYITSGNYVMKKSRVYKDGMNRTVSYAYNAIGQMTEETLAGSDGAMLTTRYKRPYDFYAESAGTTVQREMYFRHIFAPALETSVYKSGVLVNKIVNEYKDWGNGLIALQYVNQPVGGVNFQPRITYGGYDCYGNLKSLSKDDLENVSYLWGYKGQRPIAEIRNGNFSSLGQAFIDRVTQADSPSTDDMNAIEALRNNATPSGSRLTTFYYNPALNLSRVIAPNGTVNSYEYDAFGRLYQALDHNRKLTEEYQYDYKQ